MSGRNALIAFVGGEDVAAVKRFAATANLPDQQVFEGGIAQACDYLKSKQPPNLLIVEIPDAQSAPALLDQLANVVDAHTKVVVVGAVNEYSFFTWLTEIGIAHYLLKPLKSEALQAAYAKITAAPAGTGKEKEPGKVISVLGSKGGVGASSCAILLAAFAAKRSAATIALVDINPQDGAISVLLDLQPSHGFHEALEKPDRIDDLLLDRLSLKAAERLHIISAEEPHGVHYNVHPDAAPTLIAALRAKYDMVVLDVSHLLTSFSKHCLRLSDACVLVADQTLLGLRGAMHMVDFFTEAKLPAPMLIINKSGQYAKHEVGEADFEKNLKIKPAASLIHAPQIFMEIEADLKILKQEDHAALRAMGALATTLLPEKYKENANIPEIKAKKHALPILKKK